VPAGALDLARHLSHRAPVGPLEEHVLVEVGQPGLFGALVRRPHPREDLDLGHLGGVGLPHEQLEPVGEAFEVDRSATQVGAAYRSQGPESSALP
jgi:hypothetical protein